MAFVVQYIQDETSTLTMEEKVQLIQSGNLVNGILDEWEEDKAFDDFMLRELEKVEKQDAGGRMRCGGR